ncbi:VOC family protein [Corallococcus praedator]|uniref:VOC family protein n=1 Tax=Corallococcus praedator TaxID=2316724 RepID=A0ABX9QC24_9BACT|nr:MULTISPECIES: VOC family protein [Corallococcus]RKH09427.1 VOC family protein [Corallococcus sp. CA047B]RKH24753.1 VOC family protein [Corallococcus sp. CA031C]RKI00915.1 VOC family protein [Corallococcus praedator]
MSVPQKIVTCLWCNNNAEEMVGFYTSIFKDSKVLRVARHTEAGPGPKGSVLTIEFQLAGQQFLALNGGPHSPYTEAISLSVSCETQAEVDGLWDKLIANGGKPAQCGWLQDRFGLSWQIVPTLMPELLQDPDEAKRDRVIRAMMKMVKLDIAALKQAAEAR